jgi:hypothetical protein
LRAPHLLRVAQEPACFAPLLAALGAAGLRSGWLELRRPAELPASLEAAAALGAARAVAAGDGRSLAVKALRGAPVLRDLLREHFAGCALVLVAVDSGSATPAGPVADAPELRAEGEGWRVTLPPRLADAANAASVANAANVDNAANTTEIANVANPASVAHGRPDGGRGRTESAGAAASAGPGSAAAAGDGAGEHLDTPHLLARLRRPRPWAIETAEPGPIAPAPGGVGTVAGVGGVGGET